MKLNILTYTVDTKPINLILNEIQDLLVISNSDSSLKQAKWLACFNPHSYYLAQQDLLFSDALKAADWLIPDGSGVIIASKLLGEKLPGRVTGSDIFWGLHQLLDATSMHSVFFLGSTENNLSRIRDKMVQDYPNIRVAGTYSPPFKAEYSKDELNHMIQSINDSNADVLWVGMTAPKQEKWIFQNRDRLNVKFIAAVGAVFDFYTGEVKRSPVIFQKLGFEWLPRLVQQPKRLWRRMFISAPFFLWHVVLKKINN